MKYEQPALNKLSDVAGAICFLNGQSASQTEGVLCGSGGSNVGGACNTTGGGALLRCDSGNSPADGQCIATGTAATGHTSCTDGNSFGGASCSSTGNNAV